MILLIDHYDSFVHNQARYLGRLGVATCVRRYDQLDVPRVRALRPAAIILSPGPCTPRETGATAEIVRYFLGRVPLLGVCLGHQTLAAATGGRVVRAPRPCHGRASAIAHDGQLEFKNVPQRFDAARYHSLVVDAEGLPADWRVSAWTDDGIVMAIRHRELPASGWQFHPESVLTPCGYQLLMNFLLDHGLIGREVDWQRLAGCEVIREADPDDHWNVPLSRHGVPLSF